MQQAKDYRNSAFAAGELADNLLLDGRKADSGGATGLERRIQAFLSNRGTQAGVDAVSAAFSTAKMAKKPFHNRLS